MIDALHAKDPLFLAIELSGGSFDFIRYPAVSIFFGVFFILISLSCGYCICRSCIKLQSKETKRMKLLR